MKRKKTYTVKTNGTEIVFTLAKDKVADYATYNETLYRILNKDCLKPFRDEGRLRFYVWRNGRNEGFYLYDLAIACYEGRIHEDTFLDDMQKYYDYKSSNNLSVDHADNNVHNNTILNLSLMDRLTNTAKAAITAGFKPPYYLNTAYCGGKYRIMFVCTIQPDMVAELFGKFDRQIRTNYTSEARMCFTCNNAEDFVDCLHHIAEQSYEWCLPGETPKTHRRKSKHIDYWADNVPQSIKAQKILSALAEGYFQTFPFSK